MSDMYTFRQQSWEGHLKERLGTLSISSGIHTAWTSTGHQFTICPGTSTTLGPSKEGQVVEGAYPARFPGSHRSSRMQGSQAEKRHFATKPQWYAFQFFSKGTEKKHVNFFQVANPVSGDQALNTMFMMTAGLGGTVPFKVLSIDGLVDGINRLSVIRAKPPKQKNLETWLMVRRKHHQIGWLGTLSGSSRLLASWTNTEHRYQFHLINVYGTLLTIYIVITLSLTRLSSASADAERNLQNEQTQEGRGSSGHLPPDYLVARPHYI